MITNFNIENFLQEYWQKKPLLISSAYPDFISPLSADELAGLACEDDIESRIILETGNSPAWKLEQGPFSETRFSTLPESNWTLLVQGVDKHIPGVASLLDDFRFVPTWRLDDIMISYAATGGSVGPHLDQYDVFLLQAAGTRKWMINTQSYTDNDMYANLPISVLKNFSAESEWTLGPGDMLYLPPGVAHHGIAQDDDCMTISVGFRAPSLSEFVTSYIDEQVALLPASLRYRDPALAGDENPGEITGAVLEHIKDTIKSNLSDNEKIKNWFGQFITGYMYDENYDNDTAAEINNVDFAERLKTSHQLVRTPFTRANYIEDAEGFMLFINGAIFKFEHSKETIALVKSICNYRVQKLELINTYLNQQCIEVLRELYIAGYINIE